jgi:hypothetical protein
MLLQNSRKDVGTLNIFTSTATATATPSTNTLPCQTCTAHGPSFNFVVVVIALALLFAYLLGRSHGKRSVFEIFQGKGRKG